MGEHSCLCRGGRWCEEKTDFTSWSSKSVFHEKETSFNEPDICGTTSVFSFLLCSLVLRLTRMSSSLSMMVDAEQGPLSERMLKEDAPLVLDARSVGEEDFAPAVKKPGKENQDIRLYIFFLIILLVAILTVVGKVVVQVTIITAVHVVIIVYNHQTPRIC